MRKYVLRGLLVACIALASSSLYLLNRLEAQRELTSSEASGKQQAEARTADIEKQLRALEKSYAEALSERPPPTVAAAPRKGEISALSPPPVRTYSPGFYVFPTAPMTEDGRLNRPRGNGELIRSLKLGDADAEKLMNVLTDEQRRFRDALTRNSGEPLGAQDVDAIRQETERQLRDLLGDEKYAEYEDYRRYAVEHQRVNQLNARLTNDGDGALSAVQQQQLFATMKEERNRIPQPAASQYGSRSEFNAALDQWRTAYDTRVKERATAILTPEQLTTFRNLRGPGPGRGPPGRN